MRNLVFIVCTFFIISCSKENSCETIEYNQVFNAKMDQEFCFEDGSSFIITAVNDNLCPCNTQCVDAGYVSFEVDMVLENKQIIGEYSIDPILLTNAPTLPDNYKVEIQDQIPASTTICGGSTKAEDFSWNLSILKK